MAFRLFLSFAPEDRKFRDALISHLVPLWTGDRPLVEIRDATIAGSAGAAEAQIEAFIDSADVAVVLLSASYFASSTCARRELPRVMERQRRGAIEVIPVLLGHYRLEGTLLGDRAVVPAANRPVGAPENDQAWTEIVAELQKALERLPAPAGARAPAPTAVLDEATWSAQMAPSQGVSIDAAGPRLSREDLGAVQAAAVRRGLGPRVLTSGLPPEIVSNLTTEANVAATLLTHLTELNDKDRLPDGELPIVVWLKNAIQLTPLQKEQRVFQAMVAKLEAAGGKGSAR